LLPRLGNEGSQSDGLVDQEAERGERRLDLAGSLVPDSKVTVEVGRGAVGEALQCGSHERHRVRTDLREHESVLGSWNLAVAVSDWERTLSIIAVTVNIKGPLIFLILSVDCAQSK
jgi:hypothetical protein